MRPKIIVGCAILLAFVIGYLTGRTDPLVLAGCQQERQVLLEDLDRLRVRNNNLEVTLDLVRRQMETDRIAYDDLWRKVEKSEQEQMRILERIDSQKEFLQRLRARCEGG